MLFRSDLDPNYQIDSLIALAKNQYVQGLAQISIGVGLVATAAFGDVPGGVVGAGLVTSTVIGGTATAVNGTTQIMGAATHTDTSEAREAVSAVSTLPGVATVIATNGNIKAGAAASTLTNAATLAAAPKEAVRNLATAADAAQTVGETGGLIQGAVNKARNFLSPGPPAAPKAPSTPNCSVAGACPK